MENLDELLTQLKIARSESQGIKSDMKSRMDAFQGSEEWLSLQRVRETIDSGIADLEKQIKHIANAEYIKSGVKVVHPKIQIKIFKVFKIIDAAKVHKWVWDNFTLALKPDMKMVEDYVKDNAAFDGVELSEEARVQIATKL